MGSINPYGDVWVIGEDRIPRYLGTHGQMTGITQEDWGMNQEDFEDFVFGGSDIEEDI